jgi:hypothetical protein
LITIIALNRFLTEFFIPCLKKKKKKRKNIFWQYSLGPALKRMIESPGFQQTRRIVSDQGRFFFCLNIF